MRTEGSLKSGGGVGANGVRDGAGGVVGVVGTGLFSWERLSALPFSFSSLDSLLTPLEIGHQYLFTALHDVNLYLHNLHYYCGWLFWLLWPISSTLTLIYSSFSMQVTTSPFTPKLLSFSILRG
jgi:hypothetical protein